MIANTSFERIIFNIQDRERVIDELWELLLKWTANLDNSLLASCKEHLESNYSSLKSALSHLNLGMISCISDYYAIMDAHTDQFHPKYLSMYASHRGHYSTLTSSSSDFDIQELIDVFTAHYYDLNKFKIHNDIGHLHRAREQSHFVYNNLASMIASGNVYELSDGVIQDISDIVQKISPLIEDTSTLSVIQGLISTYAGMKLEVIPKEEIFDYCECGNIMEIAALSSEMICDKCGYVTKLIGTVFDDNQFYNQDGCRYKHAGYEPSKHCKCWLERIQAKETNTITAEQLEQIEARIKRDRIVNKRRLTISQLRRYLKDTGLTELNEHVALIKKLITGISPPQLSFAETQDITNSFSKAIRAYNVVRPKHKSNCLFYPFILRKLIELHVSNYGKQRDLLSFIHLQGSQTLVQNDKIWRDICEITPSFDYQPTDRYAYLE